MTHDEAGRSRCRDVVEAHELAELSRTRPAGAPRIRVVQQLPEARRLATLEVSIPFPAANALLGQQMHCHVDQGLPWCSWDT